MGEGSWGRGVLEGREVVGVDGRTLSKSSPVNGVPKLNRLLPITARVVFTNQQTWSCWRSASPPLLTALHFSYSFIL